MRVCAEHNRLELEAIEAAEQVFGPAVPEVAVFDTQFHAAMPEEAKVYAAPFDWYRQGILRYGFHGISHQYVSRRAAEILGNPRARLAFDVYTHRLCREIGGMAASLGGMDALVFTAGVGENCAPLRAAVGARLAFLGIKLCGAANDSPARDSDIAAPESRIRVLVIHTDEDWEIARECLRLLGGPAGPGVR